MQKLEPILIFITVAEMGSFTHAADSLGILLVAGFLFGQIGKVG